jgi:hypothetical protein
MTCDERIAMLEALHRNAERQLAAYRDKIDKDDLVRCLRAARDSYRGETYQLKNRIAELEEDNDELRDDVLRLEAMLRAYKQRQLEVAA